MIPIKNNYNDIINRLKILKESLTKDDSERMLFSKVITIHTIEQIHALISNEPRDFETLGSYDVIATNYFNQIREEQVDIFNRYKDFNKEMFLSVLETRVRFDYYESRRLPLSDKPTKAIDEDLLLGFLDSKFPKGINLLKKYADSINIYLFPKINSYFNSDAVMPNAISNKYNILLKDRPTTIEDIASFMHEVGHVIDSLDLVERGESYANLTWPYHYFSEVISTYLGQGFLEFLIENNIYKEEAIVMMGKYLRKSYSLLEDAFILSLTDTDTYKKIINGIYSKGGVCAMCRENPEDYIRLSKNYSERISGTQEFTYTYGMLIANAMINNDISLNDFLSIRYKDSSYEDFSSIGFNKSTAEKSLIKTINRVFK